LSFLEKIFSQQPVPSEIRNVKIQASLSLYPKNLLICLDIALTIARTP